MPDLWILELLNLVEKMEVIEKKNIVAYGDATKCVSNSKNILKSNSITKIQCKAELDACNCLDETITILKIVSRA